MNYRPEAIRLEEYTYQLPESRIAKYPLPQRDAAKLLVYRQGSLQHQTFRDLPEFVAANDLLFFNNTKVLPARLYFQKPTGGTIELFLLHPVEPTPVVAEAMLVKGEVVWECTIGNLKRWKDAVVLKRSLDVGGHTFTLRAELLDRHTRLVRLAWDQPSLNFVDVVLAAGETPLPPYLKRKAEAADAATYQTVYSKKEGAVAAPTAGLHFTEAVLDRLSALGATLDELTLHVGAGTFQPIKAASIPEHDMHNEQVIVNLQNLQNLLSGRRVIAVGTTSMRTLESLFWFGVKLLKNPEAEPEFNIEKLYPYQFDPAGLPSRAAAFQAVLDYMHRKQIAELIGETEIFIFPGYPFQVCDALITNFHQPASTLILLVAAFVGPDWQQIYNTALAADYRFLSYGDSSLLFRNSGS